jgi:hypothetical protein
MSQLGQDLPTTASLEILLINIPGGGYRLRLSLVSEGQQL